MSDRTGAPRPSRVGPGVVLGGLAVGALLGTAVAAAAEAPTGVTDTVVAARGCGNEQSIEAETPAITIREQFRTSFTAGAVTPPRTDLPAVICDR